MPCVCEDSCRCSVSCCCVESECNCQHCKDLNPASTVSPCPCGAECKCGPEFSCKSATCSKVPESSKAEVFQGKTTAQGTSNADTSLSSSDSPSSCKCEASPSKRSKLLEFKKECDTTSPVYPVDIKIVVTDIKEETGEIVEIQEDIIKVNATSDGSRAVSETRKEKSSEVSCTSVQQDIVSSAEGKSTKGHLCEKMVTDLQLITEKIIEKLRAADTDGVLKKYENDLIKMRIGIELPADSTLSFDMSVHSTSSERSPTVIASFSVPEIAETTLQSTKETGTAMSKEETAEVSGNAIAEPDETKDKTAPAS